MGKYVFLFSFLLLTSLQSSFSQEKINVPEELNFTVFYHLGPVWVKGGTLNLKTEKKIIKNDTLLKLTGKGISAEKWKWIFDIKEIYTTLCKMENFLPVKSKKYAYENGYVINNSYDFDYVNQKVFIKTASSDKKETLDTFDFSSKLYDAQSAVNYLRYKDYSDYNDGDTVSVDILLDGKFYKMNVVVYKNRIIKDKKGNEYNTLLFTAIVPKNTLFSSTEAVKVWTTDDDKRIPVKIKADLFVGSIEVLNDGIRFKKPD